MEIKTTIRYTMSLQEQLTNFRADNTKYNGNMDGSMDLMDTLELLYIEKADLELNIQKTKIMTSGSITQQQIEGEKVKCHILFSWVPKSLWTVTTAMKLKDTCPLKGKL